MKEELIESGEKRVAQEFFGKSRCNLHKSRQTRYRHVEMDHGKRQYRQKRYLLHEIRDLLGTITA